MLSEIRLRLGLISSYYQQSGILSRFLSEGGSYSSDKSWCHRHQPPHITLLTARYQTKPGQNQ
ncbi:MAG: hypothetical protein C0168_05680 [Candidatus Aminicenantes bacterium]|nr:MAG: hypothetical protein C0168_05680 [Candidatus Aminicenantes bacterium]